MRIKLLNRYWNLIRVFMPSKHGLCDPPDMPGKKIRLCTKLRRKRELEFLIHEMLHACDFSKDEAWVTGTAHDISAVLWKLGYRKTGPIPDEPVDEPEA